MLSPADAATLAFAFVAGSTATLVPKVLLRTPCDASCGADPSAPGSRSLDAPVYAATMVFGASCLGLLVEAARGYGARGAPPPTAARVAAFGRRAGRLLLLPAVLNVAGTVCQLVALVYISAAVLAGLRGAFILFTAGLSSWLGLKDRPQSRAEWACIAASAAGALLVGAGSALQAAYAPGGGGGGGEGGGGGGGAAAVAVGAAASLVGYALAAGQVALEQLLLDPTARPGKAAAAATATAEAPPKVSFTKWQILGVEGLYGLALCGGLMGALQAAHAARGGGQSALPLDVPSRTLCCLATTPAVPALSVAYGASSLAFNAALLGLSAAVGPNYRVFVFTARGVLTWAVEVALFYGGGGGGSGGGGAAAYGEGVSPFSALVLGGYVLLVGSGLWRVSLQRAGTVAAAAIKPAPELGQGGDGGGANVPLLLLSGSEDVDGGELEPTAKR
jgi:hypothetical protein